MLKVGTLLDGKYKILNVIGRGGMSVVYLAINERANKTWAVKEVRKDGGGTAIVSRGLAAETEMLKKLRHPNLPSIVDVIDRDDSFIIVMDYIEGNSLQYLLDTEGPQDPEKVIEWSKQLCDVLGYLHSRRPPIIYRDMKPANVMLRPNGEVTLIDFGTAREYKDARTEDTALLGTRGYAAPEQFGGRGQTDGRTDLFNLGATMYHLVTGRSPADTNFVIRPIGDFLPHMKGSGLEKIILKCCRPEPEQRFRNCAELMYALENVHDEDDRERARRRRRLRGFTACLVISLTAAAAGFGFRAAYAGTKGEMYAGYLADSAAEMTFRGKADAYRKAMDLDPGNAEAYEKLIEDAELLLEITATDYNLIRECIHSTRGDPGKRRFNIDFLKEKDAAAYADFHFRLGSLIYLGFPGGKGNAREYLGYALESGGLEGQKAGEAQLMYDLSEAYRKRIRNDADTRPGRIRDDSVYREYWEKLDELTRELENLTAQTGSSGYPIRVCDELAAELNSARIVNYYEQGVTESGMRETLQRASDFIDRVPVQSEFLQNQRHRVRENLDLAEDAVDDYFNATVHAGRMSGSAASGGTSRSADSASGGSV
ncbi:MAG: serine/threonine-protein kinase [Eubacteriales bacterium]|nr:serine/threonine-protein kinase [Eubacteriales bacterium]